MGSRFHHDLGRPVRSSWAHGFSDRVSLPCRLDDVTKFALRVAATWRRIDLAWSVYSFPFADPNVLDRLADGFRVAGASAGVGGYLPLNATNRLTDPKIKSLLFGKNIEGKDFWLSEAQWRQQRSADGAVEHFGYPVHAGMPESATGIDRIRNNLLCEQWPSLTRAFEICVVIFRIPEKNAQMRWGDYVMDTDTGPHPFSFIE
jgi:hypothetical protein